MTDDIVTRLMAGNWHSEKVIVPPGTLYSFQGKEFYKPMTDDIVTRLRDWANRLYPMQYGACMEQAADEIERLRKILRHVASNNPAWADPDMECRTCNDIIKEFGR